MIWNPYTADVLARLPQYCFMGREIWRAKVPLICFSVVEWHTPDRVLRQFDLFQIISEAINTETSLHSMTFTSTNNWNVKHARYIEIWEDRMNRIALGGEEDIHNYMEWYKQITRRFMTRKTLINDYMVSLYICFSLYICVFIFSVIYMNIQLTFFLIKYSSKGYNRFMIQPEMMRCQALLVELTFRVFAERCFKTVTNLL